MKAQIIDGKAISCEIKEKLKYEVETLKNQGKVPGLAVILVGEDPASCIYVAGKEKACNEVDIYSKIYKLPETVTEQEIIGIIDDLNASKIISGILVQLPMPKHINENKVLQAVDPKKDVDGLHAENIGKLLTKQNGFVSCTPKGIMKLIKSTGVSISGKHAVVVGRSNLLGKPVAQLLLNEDATVTICHTKTIDLASYTKSADILVAATPQAEFITGDMIKPGAIVIDGGTTKVNGKLKGNIHYQSALDVAGFITPVPGGVGPMTITMLLENTIEACKIYG